MFRRSVLEFLYLHGRQRGGPYFIVFVKRHLLTAATSVVRATHSLRCQGHFLHGCQDPLGSQNFLVHARDSKKEAYKLQKLQCYVGVPKITYRGLCFGGGTYDNEYSIWG